MPRPVHFELAVDDPDRAAKFYSETFGWTAQKWESPEGGDDWGYWLVTTGQEGEPGIDGAFQKRERQTGGAWMNIIGVESVDDTLAKIEAAGGSVALPKIPVPGQGYAAYAIDSEGNTFGIFEPDPTVGAEAVSATAGSASGA